MSFPRYPKYKDSGVEWLGQVPEHWNTCSLKRDLAFLTSGSRGWAENYSDDGDLFIRIANLTRDGISLDLSDIQRVLVAADVEGSRTKVRADDVLFSITAYLGSVAVVPEGIESAYVSQHVALARLRSDLLVPRWAGYVALSLIGKTWFSMQSYGGTKIQLSLDDVRSLPVTVPPIPEQHTIVAFLDRETRRFDELVAEQQRLMGLLKEKRQAVISHAVTKGLNPHAPMKPSGIEWLGNVPEHWELRNFKHAVRSIEQGWSPQCEGFPAEGTEWGILKVGSVNGGTFNSSENKLLPPDMEPEPMLAIACDDLLISRANTRELVGSAAVAERDYPTLMICDKLYRIRFQPNTCSPRFVSHYLGSGAVRGQIELGATGASSSMLNIGQSTILDLAIAMPPFQEQLDIVGFIATETMTLDVLTAEAQKTIDLLQERRTALISAAVTGQIDVRELAAS